MRSSFLCSLAPEEGSDRRARKPKWGESLRSRESMSPRTFPRTLRAMIACVHPCAQGFFAPAFRREARLDANGSALGLGGGKGPDGRYSNLTVLEGDRDLGLFSDV